MPTWLPEAIFSIVVGILGFFVKKTVSDNEKSMAQQRQDFKHEMKQQRDDFHNELEAARAEFKSAMNGQERRILKLEDTVGDIPYKYTQKEDFIRFTTSVEKKLDTIIHNQRKGE